MLYVSVFRPINFDVAAGTAADYRSLGREAIDYYYQHFTDDLWRGRDELHIDDKKIGVL